MSIALFYARKSVGGGSTSFAIHLWAGFNECGIDAELYRIVARPRGKRMLGEYSDVYAQDVTPEEALKIAKKNPSLLVAPEHSKNLPPEMPDVLQKMLKAGCRPVIHDPNEFMTRKGRGPVYDHLIGYHPKQPPFCIRPAMHEHYPSAIFIPHPYVPAFAKMPDLTGRKTACTIARLTFVKRPAILLDANRLIKTKKNKIAFHGAENRLTTFALREKYPELTQGGYDLPLRWHESALAASGYRFMVDMTYFPQDGGGSQYTFIEAWDAGSVVVLHEDWLRYPGEMKHDRNCLAVDGAESLARLLQGGYSSEVVDEIAKRSRKHLLREHDAATVATLYAQELLK